MFSFIYWLKDPQLWALCPINLLSNSLALFKCLLKWWRLFTSLGTIFYLSVGAFNQLNNSVIHLSNPRFRIIQLRQRIWSLLVDKQNTIRHRELSICALSSHFIRHARLNADWILRYYYIWRVFSSFIYLFFPMTLWRDGQDRKKLSR